MQNKHLLFSVTKQDFELSFFPCGTKGGQSANRDHSGCRIKHIASGAVGEGREFKSQGQNKEAAFSRLVKTKKFTNWLRLETARRMMNYQSIEAMIEDNVDKQMNPANLRIEVKDASGKWVVVDDVFDNVTFDSLEGHDII